MLVKIVIKKNSNQKQNKPNKTEKKIIEAHFEVFKEKKLQIKSYIESETKNFCVWEIFLRVANDLLF